MPGLRIEEIENLSFWIKSFIRRIVSRQSPPNLAENVLEASHDIFHISAIVGEDFGHNKGGELGAHSERALLVVDTIARDSKLAEDIDGYGVPWLLQKRIGLTLKRLANFRGKG